MNIKEIQELIKLINKTNVTEFKLKDGEFEITVRTEEFTKAKSMQQQVIQQVPVAPPPVPPVSTSAPAPAPATAGQASEATPVEDVPKKAAKESEGQYVEVKSPMVGTFYRSPSPEKPAYVQVGDVIEKGSTVCIIEAMKLFNEIDSEVSGKIVKVLVDDAQPVEFDQPLFLVDPS